MTMLRPLSRLRPARRWLVLLALSAPVAGAAATADDTIALAPQLGFESVRLPGGERLGLLGGSLLFGAGGDWWLGPAVYGAASGQRGGLFVGGVEVQHRWRLGRQTLSAGFFAGGGGGAAAPVGSGLMLRPALTLLRDFGPAELGVSLSEVKFPSGAISGRQLGIVARWDGRFRHAGVDHVGDAATGAGRSGVGFDRILGTVSSYSLRGRGVEPRRIGLVGTRLDHDLGGGLYAGLEAAAAATGGAAGYMEVLGVAGWDAAVQPRSSLRLGVHGSLGLGGGGGVPTGGGPIAKLAVDASISPLPSWRSGLSLGWLRGLDSPLRAPTLQWWIAAPLEPSRSPFDAETAHVARVEWTGSLQHYAHAHRKDGSTRALDTVGLKFALYQGEHLYATGQAHSAFAGGAGAYSVGLVGLGLATGAKPAPWRAGVEAMIGAAGGGGVDSGGGAIAQALAWAAWAPTHAIELRAGVGALRSRGGSLSTPVAELAVSWAFGQPMR